MKIYRAGAKPEREELGTFDLWLPRHHVMTALLAIFGGLLFIPLVSMLLAIGHFELWMAWSPGMGASLIAIAILLRARRRRPMRIVREGEVVRLILDRGPALRFPIELSGAQLVVRVRNADNWRLFLRLRGADDRALLLEEGRGLIHGKQEDWLGGMTVPEAPPDYMVKANSLAQIRARVEALNGELGT